MDARRTSKPNDHWFTAPNPLLQCLPDLRDPTDLLERLAFDPLAGLDLKSLSFLERDALLSGEKTPFEPTTQNLRSGMTWWGMQGNGLRARNPYRPEIKQHIWAIQNAAAQGKTIFPSFPTKGIAINVQKGATGTSKTVMVDRYCQMMPQVWVHGPDDEAGWTEMTQLVYLKVDLPHDGSRGGFLFSILLAIDNALGTSYAYSAARTANSVDKLTVHVIATLTRHYTGILFIDEAQLRNLIQTGQALQIQGLLLMFMNAGIPTVIQGNEMAFSWINFSQDTSRLHSTPQEILSPIGAIENPNTEADWAAVATGVMRYYVLLDPIIDPEGCSHVLRMRGGGISRLTLFLWCFAQRTALHEGRESIGPADIQTAYESVHFDELRPLADGFYYRKPELLLGFKDVDVSYYANHWGIPISQNESAATSKTETATNAASNTGPKSNDSKKTSPSAASKFAAEQTREKRKAEKRNEVAQSLPTNDIRVRGLADVQLAGLAGIKKEIEAQEN